ncbi:P-loop containing nucleoside triphosphate hydrolase protein [Mycena polygramma]|nr:P-loop containing nucleoside triphosphate hydrolase protein [Mycena polygramma]
MDSEKLRAEDAKPLDSKLDDYSYTTRQLGVWRVLFANDSVTRASLFSACSFSQVQLIELNSNIALVWRFVKEIYALAPGLILLLFLLRLGQSLEATMMLYTSSRLLRSVEKALTEGHPDVIAILHAVMIRLFCMMFSSMAGWARNRTSPLVRRRVNAHFQEYMLRERLRLDVPTSADKNNEFSFSPSRAWRRFEFLSEMLQRNFQLLSQIIFTLRQPSGGITLTALSLLSPFIVSKFSWRSMWNKSFVAYSNNFDYLRLQALRRFCQYPYHEQATSANMMDWIVAEYRKAREGLGDINDDLHSDLGTPVSGMLALLSVDLPTFYWAASVIMRPGDFSIASFAILQQHAQGLRTTISALIYEFSRLSSCVSDVRELYKIATVKNKVVDGEEAYPSRTSSPDGMEFEFQNVSFAYPGAKSRHNAVKDVSFKIPAGHLIVIVGANGSGKTTLIKLMNRLFDVDSGEIFVDGLPIQNYRLAHLRNAQALLAQDHMLYSLTLAENIGVGNPDHITDTEMVVKAAEAGGASEVIGKLTEGLGTMLAPVRTVHSQRLDETQHKKLREIVEDLERPVDIKTFISARTFMRLLSGRIRFAAADEPSSALDPKAEHQLFQRLRNARGGKTLVFVTHRFGHLTKHADLILCLKDGEVVERGTHKELMARAGEYSELYNVQAQAFEM